MRSERMNANSEMTKSNRRSFGFIGARYAPMDLRKTAPWGKAVSELPLNSLG
jgi:hypothetical protein